jgi:hypothetical protein
MSWSSVLPWASQVCIFLAALGGLIKSRQNANKLVNIHLQLNSRLDELIKAANAQGRQDERNSLNPRK